MTRIVIGWREWVSLPDLGIKRIKAKIDTGARTSALHAFRIEPARVDGTEGLRIGVHPLQRRTDIETFFFAPLADERWVTDSGGHREKRYVIATRLLLNGVSRRIELTLTNRDSMRFRLLLGRTAMQQDILIKPDRSYLLGRPGETAGC
jgi:hypothetical protein